MEQNNSTLLNIVDILKLLPHRYPFLLVDRVLTYGIKDGSEYGIGIKNVSINEQFFQGHFPHEPIFPGVLIIEALAQISGIAILANLKEQIIANQSMYFVKIENAIFKNKVVPGDVLELHSIKTRQIMKMYIFETKAMVENEIVAEAKLIATFQ